MELVWTLRLEVSALKSIDKWKGITSDNQAVGKEEKKNLLTGPWMGLINAPAPSIMECPVGRGHAEGRRFQISNSGR